MPRAAAAQRSVEQDNDVESSMDTEVSVEYKKQQYLLTHTIQNTSHVPTMINVLEESGINVSDLNKIKDAGMHTVDAVSIQTHDVQ